MTDESQKKSIGTCKRIFHGDDIILNEDLWKMSALSKKFVVLCSKVSHISVCVHALD